MSKPDFVSHHLPVPDRFTEVLELSRSLALRDALAASTRRHTRVRDGNNGGRDGNSNGDGGRNGRVGSNSNGGGSNGSNDREIDPNKSIRGSIRESLSHSSSDSEHTKLPPVPALPTTPVLQTRMSAARRAGIVFLVFGHVISLYALWDLITMADGATALRWLVASMAGYVVTGTMGITAGAHRLWAHRSYKATLPARLVLALANSIAFQSSILHWVIEHRVHHLYTDTDADPHNINRGFWYAHMGWLFQPRTEAFCIARRRVDASDLRADPVVYYQDKYYAAIGPFCCFILPALMGQAVTGEFWRSFVMLGCLRWVLCLHATWCVNSVAHTWGARPYRPNEKPTETGFVSLISGGEGWHNWHHAFPWDYAASEMRPDVFWRWNLARFWIDAFAVLGWVWDRKVQRNGDVFLLQQQREEEAAGEGDEDEEDRALDAHVVASVVRGGIPGASMPPQEAPAQERE